MKNTEKSEKIKDQIITYMLLKYLNLTFIYLKDFLVFSVFITILTFYLFLQLGTSSITALIWFKIITSVIGVTFHYKRKAKEIFFYMNIGLGKKELIISAIIVDLTIWIVGFTLLVKLIL